VKAKTARPLPGRWARLRKSAHALTRFEPKAGKRSGEIDLTAEETQAIGQIASAASRKYVFPPRIERLFQRHVRENSRTARMSATLLTFLLYATAPLWSSTLIASPEQSANFMSLIELLLMAPLFAAATIAQARYIASDTAEWLLIGAFLLETLCVEVIRRKSEAVGFFFDPSIVVLVPVTVLVLLRLRISRNILFIVLYMLILVSEPIWWPDQIHVRSATVWLMQVLLLLIVLLSAIWSKLSSRRQWAAGVLLELMAYRDSLTGLPNRRAFEEHYEIVIKAMSRGHKKKLILALVDLDHFKKLNDDYGHDYGDGALAEVALTLAQFARRSLDIAARLGGEEFALLLYDCDPDTARERLGELVQVIAGLGIENKNSERGILTCSIGVAVVAPNESLGTAYRSADELLYRVKNAGRNNFAMAG
jgi:diguanylate cyclase (GGDEF)-like protein